MADARRPTLEVVDQDMIERIIDEAYQVLEDPGVMIEDDEALRLLADAGADVDFRGRTVKMGRELVGRCLESAPSSIDICGRDGKRAMRLEGDKVHFAPGSTALNFLDSTGVRRKPVTEDYVKFSILTDAVENIDAQSTAMVPSDVPGDISDRYRLYIALQYCTKPIVTGAFTVEGFEVMREMLIAVTGSEERLRDKPIAIFDVCPSPPLKWSHLTCRNLVDCARGGIPVELVSMPLSGLTAPVTLAGSLVQHTAENLSGVVISQVVQPGSAVIYGGSPAILDMREATTPMGAIETMMMDCAYSQIGKHLGLPTHAYMGLSDAKGLDAQSGLESGIGTILAALAGINVVSGPGMLDFENCQSLEKLVVDDGICGMVKRLLQGIAPRGGGLGVGLLRSGEHFLTSEHTLRWFREEQYMPGEVIDRASSVEWERRGAKSSAERARDLVERHLSEYRPMPLADDVVRELRRIMSSSARRYGMEKLPV